MNKEIKEILDYLEIPYGEACELKNYITNLIEELKLERAKNKSLLNTIYGIKTNNKLKFENAFSGGYTHKSNMIKFWLDGCDISFLAVAPEDITLKQLLKQCNRIKPKWCSCGINSKNIEDYHKVEIIIDYNNVKKANDDVSCDILEDKGE